MTRVAIHGASGRMGRNLLSACLDHPELELGAAVVRPGSDVAGTDAGVLAGRDPVGLVTSEELDPAAVDVVVDFSTPDATLAALERCQGGERGCAWVIGTTGFSPAQRATLAAAGRELPLVLAPNTGVGVNVVFGLVAAAAGALGDDYDVEIIEAHHRHKVDAPSGTAIRLGETAARALGRDLDRCAVYERSGHTGAREAGAIGFSTVRGGEIVGEHTVLFAGTDERIEITHRAASRRVFAQGAMRAAQWLAAQPPGFYDMQDVLGLAQGGS